MKRLFLLCLALLSACSSSQESLKVAASSVPHAEILSVAKEELRERGIELKIIEVDDYNLPNRMLYERQIDANFFQHQPFLDEQNRLHGYGLVTLTKVHIEPLGVYSDYYKSLPDGNADVTFAIPQDPTNEARALLLLQDLGLIELRTNSQPTVLDIIENPKKIRFIEVDAPFLPRSLQDVDYAVIPVNFALQANLDPEEDALALEASDSPYANIVAVRPEDQEKPTFQSLKRVLQGEKVQQFIEEKYRGAILRAR